MQDPIQLHPGQVADEPVQEPDTMPPAELPAPSRWETWRQERAARRAARPARPSRPEKRSQARARRPAPLAPVPAPSAPVPAAGPARRRRLALAAAVPVAVVNAVAFSGQLAYLRDHLSWPLPGQIGFALALESIAVYLAYHAHVAQLANDSAMRLRLASYGFALLIAGMNYSHYAPHWRPTFAALALGLMSASSPWLWAIHSRRESRDALMAQGLVEHHAVRLGSTRWTWHPVRSARVMWHATWAGITSPAEAIAAAEAAEMAAELPVVEIEAEILTAMSARDRLAWAFGAVGAVDVPRALALLADKGAPIDQSHAYQVRRAILPAAKGGE